jgi:hypothetical protein
MLNAHSFRSQENPFVASFHIYKGGPEGPSDAVVASSEAPDDKQETIVADPEITKLQDQLEAGDEVPLQDLANAIDKSTDQAIEWAEGQVELATEYLQMVADEASEVAADSAKLLAEGGDISAERFDVAVDEIVDNAEEFANNPVDATVARASEAVDAYTDLGEKAIDTGKQVLEYREALIYEAVHTATDVVDDYKQAGEVLVDQAAELADDYMEARAEFIDEAVQVATEMIPDDYKQAGEALVDEASEVAANYRAVGAEVAYNAEEFAEHPVESAVAVGTEVANGYVDRANEVIDDASDTLKAVEEFADHPVDSTIAAGEVLAYEAGEYVDEATDLAQAVLIDTGYELEDAATEFSDNIVALGMEAKDALQ